MMQVNSRSVLRPEYFAGASFVSCTENTLSEFIQNQRFNTNTAPVYTTENPGPQRKKALVRRQYSYPYLKPSRVSVTADHQYPCGAEHPAIRGSSSTVPLRLNLPLSEGEMQVYRCSQHSVSPTPSHASRYSTDSSSSFIHFAQRSTLRPITAQSHPRSHSHGQAEQLRRSRESNTFALIDAQLSRAPLSHVRDLYMNNRANSVSSTAARTTKKANLSVVHAVVRFRIQDSLFAMREHMNKLKDMVLKSTYPNYDTKDRDRLASQMFGFKPVPCCPDCEHCDRLLERTNNRQFRRFNRVRSHERRQCVNRDSKISTAYIHPEFPLRPFSNSSSSASHTPGLTTSDIKVHVNEASCSTVEKIIPSNAFNSSDVTSPSSLFEGKLDNQFNYTENCFNLPMSQALNNAASRIQDDTAQNALNIDSSCMKMCCEFDSTDWSAIKIDMGPCGDEAVDLHSLIAQDPLVSNTPIKCEFIDPLEPESLRLEYEDVLPLADELFADMLSPLIYPDQPLSDFPEISPPY